MKKNSKKSAIGSLVAVVAAVVVAKGLWVTVSSLYLPHSGVDLKEDQGLKPLYYHYNLASKKEVLKPIVHKKLPKKEAVEKVINKEKPKKITSFILKGLYNSKEKKIAVIEYLGKTAVLKVGEELEEYRLKGVFDTFVTFSKDDKEYKVKLYTKEKPKKEPKQPATTQIKKQPKNMPKVVKKKPIVEAPRQEGDTTVIPKNLFNRYRGNIKQIRRNINATPNMVNGQLEGFKISFVRSGSDFSKLGLKRGDIMTAINGEPLTNFKVPIEFFNKVNTMTSATITIKRGNEMKELEYEVR